ncbi:MAG TPA: Uma2 family endonuclease [Saprospiraceae bacterium]|nr:Uma2 family endonuclease [Saprospiraceae bacterium]HMQ85094.1 Uma2 family endonuclease [Saprospiraceae bacterium]
MFDENEWIDKIMEQPGAALIVKRVQSRLKKEQLARKQFYNQIGEDDKAEFVNGKIWMHSLVMKAHNDVTKALLILLNTYVEENNLGYVGVEKIMVSFTRNDYEPDVCFFGLEKAKHFKEDQLLFPVPDFIAEVLSKSSQAIINHDRITKFNDYEVHGVKEYWIIDPYDKVVEQYVLENGVYHLILKAAEGKVNSQVIAGFHIPILALFQPSVCRDVLKAIMNNTL